MKTSTKQMQNVQDLFGTHFLMPIFDGQHYYLDFSYKGYNFIDTFTGEILDVKVSQEIEAALKFFAENVENQVYHVTLFSFWNKDVIIFNDIVFDDGMLLKDYTHIMRYGIMREFLLKEGIMPFEEAEPQEEGTKILALNGCCLQVTEEIWVNTIYCFNFEQEMNQSPASQFWIKGFSEKLLLSSEQTIIEK